MAVKISENELRSIIREFIAEALSKSNFNNNLKKRREFELPEINCLTEGLFRSYDESFVERYLTKKLNFTNDKNKFSKGEAEGFFFSEEDINDTKDNINILIPVSYPFIEDLSKIMNACGYILSYKETIMEGIILKLEYEKKFQEEIRGLVGKYKYIYHLTPSVYVNKIMKQGLVPKNSNKYLSYPPRIYFILDKQTINYKMLANMLYNAEYSYSNEKDKENISQYKDEYTLLRCDTSKLIGKVKFYIDNNLPNSVYVTENIPPQFIEIVETNIKVNK